MKVSPGGGEEQDWEEYGGYGEDMRDSMDTLMPLGLARDGGKEDLKEEEKEKGTEHASIVGKWGIGRHNAQVRGKEKGNLWEGMGKEDMGTR